MYTYLTLLHISPCVCLGMFLKNKNGKLCNRYQILFNCLEAGNNVCVCVCVASCRNDVIVQEADNIPGSWGLFPWWHPDVLFAKCIICVCAHSWLVKGAGCYVLIKMSNPISLQKTLLHLAKQECNPDLAELFQDILERHSRIVRKCSWHLECRGTEDGTQRTCSLLSALLSALSPLFAWEL